MNPVGSVISGPSRHAWTPSPVVGSSQWRTMRLGRGLRRWPGTARSARLTEPRGHGPLLAPPGKRSFPQPLLLVDPKGLSQGPAAAGALRPGHPAPCLCRSPSRRRRCSSLVAGAGRSSVIGHRRSGTTPVLWRRGVGGTPPQWTPQRQRPDLGSWQGTLFPSVPTKTGS